MTICLLTDFGTRDPYAAAMKGVLRSRTDAEVVDLTHEIAAFDAWEAAFFLRDVVPYWPAGTIFVVVVDPGVGTSRDILAVKSDEKTFLAPDNGALHFIAGAARVVENEALFLPESSTTFHGRDRFAPAAAALANGTPITMVGPPIDQRVPLDYTAPTATRGTITRIDRFGNAVTDLAVRNPRSAVRVGRHIVDRWATTYEGEGPFLIIGSTGHIEISAAQASAATLLQLARGDRIELVES